MLVRIVSLSNAEKHIKFKIYISSMVHSRPYIEENIIFKIEARPYIISIPCLSPNGPGALSARPTRSKLHRLPIGSQNAIMLCGGAAEVQTVIKHTLLQLKRK